MWNTTFYCYSGTRFWWLFNLKRTWSRVRRESPFKGTVCRFVLDYLLLEKAGELFRVVWCQYKS